MSVFYQKLSDLLASQVPFVSVTLVDSLGSVPQEAGAKMLVTEQGLLYGTVGGGKVENQAIQEAVAMLAAQASSKRTASSATRFVEWNLNRDVGMTCGGSVRLYLECFNQNVWTIAVFGAGHIAQALIPLLLTLECRVICLDSRPEWLALLPNSPQLQKVQSDTLVESVGQLPEHAFVALMTMGHGTDKPILIELMKARQAGIAFPYIGVIGSRAKAARLKADLAEAGLPEAEKASFFCPIGLPLGGNQPQEIAISIVAQLIQERDRLSAASSRD
jgi:xanthine dehydrogenase accessory factor